MTYLLALDQGTSSSRSIVFDERGHIVAQAQLGLPLLFPQPAWGVVAQGVVDEVGEGAAQLDRCAQQLLAHAGGMGRRKFQLVCALTALAQ